MITVPYIEPNPPAQPSNRGGRPDRAVAAVQAVKAPGRALATQRDALYFRSEAILRLGAPTQAPFLAQQIGQLWLSTPAPAPKAALDAYLKHNSPHADDLDRNRASVLA